jgi:hypothetical protein
MTKQPLSINDIRDYLELPDASPKLPEFKKNSDRIGGETENTLQKVKQTLLDELREDLL